MCAETVGKAEDQDLREEEREVRGQKWYRPQATGTGEVRPPWASPARAPAGDPKISPSLFVLLSNSWGETL